MWSKSIKAQTGNNSLIFPKSNSYEEKSIYEVVQNFENNKVFYASKLIIDDNLNKKSKEDNLYLKKSNDNIISSYPKLFGNKNNLLDKKYRYNSMDIKNKNAKKIKFISVEKMKLLSKKGFEQLINKKMGDLTNQINDVVGVIEKNKKQFQKILKMSGQIYAKNKQISLMDVDDELL